MGTWITSQRFINAPFVCWALLVVSCGSKTPPPESGGKPVQFDPEFTKATQITKAVAGIRFESGLYVSVDFDVPAESPIQRAKNAKADVTVYFTDGTLKPVKDAGCLWLDTSGPRQFRCMCCTVTRQQVEKLSKVVVHRLTHSE